MEMSEELSELTTSRLWSKRDIWDQATVPPPKGGAYGWWFRNVPPLVPTESCLSRHGFTLLYLGFSPQKPNLTGKGQERHIRQRIRYHFRGNASGSTLRLSLGCLLQDELKLVLQNVGKKKTFGETGEQTLSDWISENGRVSWVESERPWRVEKHAQKHLHLPLNLVRNSGNPFHATLTELRTKSLDSAK